MLLFYCFSYFLLSYLELAAANQHKRPHDRPLEASNSVQPAMGMHMQKSMYMLLLNISKLDNVN